MNTRANDHKNPAGANLAGANPAGANPAQGLALRNITVRYDDGPKPRRKGAGHSADTPQHPAVDAVSLDIAPGQIVALLGPSGCGKSSLLRAIAGLEPLATGTVRWNGENMAGIPVHRRGFGLMFQDGQLFAHRDVARNVAYGMTAATCRPTGQDGTPLPATGAAHRSRRRVEPGLRDRRVAELLELVGLPGYEQRTVPTLSGGERQRVALARALAPRPRLLLLDEPLSALDRGLRERLAVDLRAVLTATGTTAILVTHDHDEAFSIADRIAIMSEGQFLQVADPEELWRHPASREVAGFLGYQAFVRVAEPVNFVSASASPVSVSALAGGHATGRGPALLAVGPRGFVVDRGGDEPTGAAASGIGPFDAVVLGTVFRRGEAEVTCRATLPDGDQRVAARFAGDGLSAGVGDRVRLFVDPTECAAIRQDRDLATEPPFVLT